MFCRARQGMTVDTILLDCNVLTYKRIRFIKYLQKELHMQKIKVLLVDDEEEFINTLSERIMMRGFKSDVALNGEEALKILDKYIPDVMVVDLKMPGIGGMDFLRRVKETNPEIQVIMLTGHGSKGDEAEARRFGVSDYLQKPVAIDMLIQSINCVCRNK